MSDPVQVALDILRATAQRSDNIAGNDQDGDPIDYVSKLQKQACTYLSTYLINNQITTRPLLPFSTQVENLRDKLNRQVVSNSITAHEAADIFNRSANTTQYRILIRYQDEGWQLSEQTSDRSRALEVAAELAKNKSQMVSVLDEANNVIWQST